jgi:hypothetical protein
VGQRVAPMRARSAWSSASGVSIVNGRIAAGAGGFNVATDMGVSFLSGWVRPWTQATDAKEHDSIARLSV